VRADRAERQHDRRPGVRGVVPDEQYTFHHALIRDTALASFRERGFEPSSVERLPAARASLYNFQRNSKIFEKAL